MLTSQLVLPVAVLDLDVAVPVVATVHPNRDGARSGVTLLGSILLTIDPVRGHPIRVNGDGQLTPPFARSILELPDAVTFGAVVAKAEVNLPPAHADAVVAVAVVRSAEHLENAALVALVIVLHHLHGDSEGSVEVLFGPHLVRTLVALDVVCCSGAGTMPVLEVRLSVEQRSVMAVFHVVDRVGPATTHTPAHSVTGAVASEITDFVVRALSLTVDVAVTVRIVAVAPSSILKGKVLVSLQASRHVTGE